MRGAVGIRNESGRQMAVLAAARRMAAPAAMTSHCPRIARNPRNTVTRHLRAVPSTAVALIVHIGWSRSAP